MASFPRKNTKKNEKKCKKIKPNILIIRNTCDTIYSEYVREPLKMHENTGALRENQERRTVALHFQLFISSILGNGLSNTGFMLLIAALACVLGAEVACIGILISKMIRARKERAADEEEDDKPSTHAHALIPLLAVAAVPQTMYATLSALAAITAFFAVVLLVLLVVCRLMRYDFVKASSARKSVADKPEAAPAPAAEPSVAEEPADEPEAAGLEPLTVFADEPTLVEEPVEEPVEEIAAEVTEEVTEEAAEEVAEEVAEEAAEEILAEETAEETAVAILPAVPAEEVAEVTVTQTVSTEPVAQDPAFADGSRPYKVVEKVVTETVKEIIKETPVPMPAPAPAAPAQETKEGSSTELFFEKLSDFLEYELQRRREFDAAAAQQSFAKGESVPTFSRSADALDEEDELEDDAELALEDEEDETLDADHAKDEDDVDDAEEDRYFTGNERIIGFVEETGCYLVASYRKSFEAKLIQAKPHIKKYYSELKNALLAYKGTKDRISWAADTFHNGRTQIAKINAKPRILELYLALDPASLEGTMYKGRDVGSKKKYADTPFQYKIRTPRKLKWALELVARTCEEHGLSPIDIETVDYAEQYPFDTTDNLVERKLIKEYIREQKPATTFELDPDHVPDVPDEDESVIPANANFSWEFDNDTLTGEDREVEPVIEEEPVAEEEPAVEAEPTVEEEPAAEPAPAPAVEPQKEVVRETVKVTEMRYTERYYADPANPVQSTVTVKEPIEAIAEPASEEMTVEELTADLPTAEEISAELPTAEEMMAELSTADDAPVEEAAEEIVEEIVEEVAEEIAEEILEEEPEERFFEDVEPADPFAEFSVPAVALPVDAPAEETVEEDAIEEEAAFDEPIEEDVIEEEAAEEEAIEDEIVEDEPVEEVLEETVEEELYEEALEEAYEEEPAEEEYTEEEYTEEEYTEEEYAEEEYAEEEYAEEEYTEEEYTEEEYAEEEYAEEEYAEEEAEEPTEGQYPFRPSFYANRRNTARPETYAEEEYAEEEYAEEEYAEEEYAEEEYAEEYTEETVEEEAPRTPKVSMNPAVAMIDICVVEAVFPEGATVNLSTLKQKGVVLETAEILKVYAGGSMTKALNVEAHQFTLDAIRAISEAGGNAAMIR